MGFSKSIKERVLVNCRRHCALCHKFCGTKIELHHIKQKADGGKDSYENCIPLCFDCHAEVKAYNARHPKGTAYTDSELIKHRDKLYKRDSQTRGKYDERNEKILKEDKKMYQDIKEIIYSSGAINFLRNHHFATPFYRNILELLYKFIRECEYNPEFEFLDTDLESLKVVLLESIKEFLNAAELNTFLVNNNNELCSVPNDWLLREDTKQTFNESVEELNTLSSDIANKYDCLVKLAKRKLLIYI